MLANKRMNQPALLSGASLPPGAVARRTRINCTAPGCLAIRGVSALLWLMGPQQRLSVPHLMGLHETAGNLTRDRGLPRFGLLAPRASCLADTAAGHPRHSG